jgi:hypothetical protein
MLSIVITSVLAGLAFRLGAARRGPLLQDEEM